MTITTDWTTAHPKGLATVSDIAALESTITGKPIHRRTVHRRLEGSDALRAKWAPAVVDNTAAGKIYDVATYLALREEHGVRWDADSKED
jgi:hypothetical protein